MADQHDQPDEQAAKKPAPRPVTAKRPPEEGPGKKGAREGARPERPGPEGARQGRTAAGRPRAPAEVPALEPAPPHAALTAGPNPAREAAASAKETVRQAGAAPSAPAGGDSACGCRSPSAAAVNFIALLLRQLRRG